VREAFVRFDGDGDGVLRAAELPAPVWQALRASDADADGALSKDELYEARGRARARPAR
jgi:Ca2+-binding EF-hand superfamily protein